MLLYCFFTQDLFTLSTPYFRYCPIRKILYLFLITNARKQYMVLAFLLWYAHFNTPKWNLFLLADKLSITLHVICVYLVLTMFFNVPVSRFCRAQQTPKVPHSKIPYCTTNTGTKFPAQKTDIGECTGGWRTRRLQRSNILILQKKIWMILFKINDWFILKQFT